MPTFASRVFACLAAGVLSGLVVRAAKVDYSRDIQPLLQQRCYSCHSRLKQEGGLRLDAGVLVHRGGKDGPVLMRSTTDPGELIRRITARDPDERMPAEGRALTTSEVALLRDWVEQGAPFPSEEKIPVAPADHWAFQPVQRPPIPAVKDAQWPRNPVDAFVLAKLESRGWTPASEAVPGALLRRVYLDVTGLPPTLAEQEAFAVDPSPDRLDRVVDDLLARPAYGERWARHWLDVVRYADSNGYERDAEKPSVWRYRDYVISALNADLPFDRFIVEQLAGDELTNVNRATLLATTFTRLGHWDDEPADPDTDRFDQLDDIVSTTGQAFLGLTIGCARCHDHKFEPLTAKDYYQLVAVFASLQRPQNGRTELTIPAGTPEEVATQATRDGAIAAWLGRTNELPKAAIEVEVARLRTETPDLPDGYIMRDVGPTVAPTHVLVRGSVSRPGAEVAPNIPAVLGRHPLPPIESNGRTSGRRLAFARWLACAENPLTARVIV
ncbi:MAG TPA: DUF1549 domain-containing protein, partial [Verrucomicrobiota bacterium]|nr:DUF1549 domain-containing protein [Verrucomicrobiota bacterium]